LASIVVSKKGEADFSTPTRWNPRGGRWSRVIYTVYRRRKTLFL
jgi:hypothetical protein